MRHTAIVCALTVLGILCPYARGEQLDTDIYNVSVPASPFPLNSSVTIHKFSVVDPNDNVTTRALQSIKFELSLDFAGTMQFENTDPNFSTTFQFLLTWTADLIHPDPNGTPQPLVHLAPSRSRSGLADPYDGETNYHGESGATWPVSYLGATGSVTVADISNLSYFTHAGPQTVDVSLPLTGSHSFQVQAPDSHSHSEQVTDARITGGNLKVTYTYIVPEPASAALLLLSGFLSRRRR